MFNSASKLAVVGYAEEAGARILSVGGRLYFEAIPFECIGRDSIGFGMAAKSRRSL